VTPVKPVSAASEVSPKRAIRRAALVIGAMASGLVALLLVLHALDPLENVASDQFVRWRGSRPADSRIALCAIDGASIDTYGRWPWRRSVLARLIDRLSAEGARAIALDIVLSEPSYPELAADDVALAASIERAGNVVLGVFFRDVPDRSAPGLSGAEFSNVAQPPGGFDLPREAGVEGNLEPFAYAAAGQGFFDHQREAGVLRHYRLIRRYNDQYFPPLALRAVERFYRGRRGGPATADPDAGLRLKPAPGGLPSVLLDGWPLPIDEGGRVRVDYRGPAGTYRPISAADVLAGKVPPEKIRDRLVIVGLTDTGVGDFVETPFGQMPGVEVHANVADGLLNKRSSSDNAVMWVLSLVATLALGPLVALLVAAVERHRYGSLAAALVLLAWPAICLAVLVDPGWHLQSVPPLLAGGLALAGALRYRVGREEERSREIRRTFEHFVAKPVVEQMLRRPGDVQLGGERREITVLFSDIRGFTNLSEKRQPQEVMTLLNEYFTPMTQSVLDAGGTLDKFMGDAVMALFGAPLDQPDHAHWACRAALAMRRDLVRLNAGWQARGTLGPGQKIGIGIGLNSGPVAVGNVGSNQVFGYTAIGDNVNLGSRLEGLNKKYGTEAIVSEATAQAARSVFLFRELDCVRVKGKKEPVAIFELVGEIAQATDRDRQRAERSAEGLAAYRARDFAAAEAVFAALVEQDVEDHAAALLLVRCRRLQAEPPGPEWDGVDTLTEK
jgi:adenylate cyclase